MSDFSGNWFRKVFKKNPQPLISQEKKVVSPNPPSPEPTPPRPALLYKKGDFINQDYEVQGVLGKGGFGVVYLVYSHTAATIYALKTFQDEFLATQEVRERFLKEANLWIELGRHTNLVHAHYVDEISGRLYIVMEYIAPNEQGLNTLDSYLQQQPIDLVQGLCWAIQVCYGMEYAYSRGLRAHRDLKPANIMIGPDKTAKVTDFGLAGAISTLPVEKNTSLRLEALSKQTMFGAVFGTPTHMAPEQFVNAAGCNECSDIYSFGVILFQLASGGRLPFLPAAQGGQNTQITWQEFYRLHSHGTVPRLNSPLMPIIAQCLAKQPDDRPASFGELRRRLEALLKEETGQAFQPPQQANETVLELAYRGYSFNRIGRFQEAFECYAKAITCVPEDGFLWRGKGAALVNMGRFSEAVACFDQALQINPQDAVAWNCKGGALSRMGRQVEAIACLDRALEIGPPNADALCNKACILSDLERYKEAITCAEQTLQLIPRHAAAWCEKGRALHALGQLNEAAHCYDQALQFNPYLPVAWYNKGLIAEAHDDLHAAVTYHRRFLELKPGDHYQHQIAHSQAVIQRGGNK